MTLTSVWMRMLGRKPKNAPSAPTEQSLPKSTALCESPTSSGPCKQMSEQQLGLFDLPGAVAARDAALAKVLGNSGPWVQAALDCLTPEFKRTHPTFTGESLRVSLLTKIDQPHSHNAWGALVKKLLHHKIIRPTGRWVSMSTKSSHARATRTYYWT